MKPFTALLGMTLVLNNYSRDYFEPPTPIGGTNPIYTPKRTKLKGYHKQNKK